MASEPGPAGELLLEVRAEDMPPRLVPELARRLAMRLFEVLMDANVAPAEVATGWTRRRLMVCCKGLPKGQPSTAVLGEMLPALLADLPAEQSMVWGEGRGPWLRPIRSIVALFAGHVVPFTFCGIAAGRSTAGHPILSPERFDVADSDDYFAKLAARGIEVRVEERCARLAAELAQREANLGGMVTDAAQVVARMARDCEIPGLIDGSIAPEHLALPAEIVTGAIAERPGAVVLRDAEGALLPCFLTVMDRPDDPSGLVRAGYERTVSGRLADAAFLRQADRRRKLGEHAARLGDLESPQGGSWADHDARVGTLAVALLEQLDRGALAPAAEEAAKLMHADRVTALVAELGLPPGMVGGLYARDEGYDEAVWQAIFDHQLPDGEDGPLPRGEVGCMVALTDRLLSLAAAMGRSADPSTGGERGQRRLADGVVRLLIEGRLEIDVDLLVGRAVRLLGGQVQMAHEELTLVASDLLRERAGRLLGRRGFSRDEVAAASAVRGGSLVALLGRVEALRARRSDPALLALVRTARRIERVMAGNDPGAVVASLAEPAERGLAETLATVRKAVDVAVADHRYEDALDGLAPLAGAVDRLFDEVLVMAENTAQRATRLALLQGVRRQLGRIGKLSALGPTAAAADAEART